VGFLKIEIFIGIKEKKATSQKNNKRSVATFSIPLIYLSREGILSIVRGGNSFMEQTKGLTIG